MRREWTDDEVHGLVALYESAGQSGAVGLREYAAKIGRDHHNVCRKARALGLTNRRRRKPESCVEAIRMRAPTQWRVRPHPRGMAGKRHTPETIAKMSAGSVKAWSDRMSQIGLDAAQTLDPGRNRYSRCAGGRRADLGNRYFRSTWEANYARYLEWLKKHGSIGSWDYECKTFVFVKITRGTRAYTPDFRVVFPNGRVEWHEVKGWMDPKSKTRLARMRRYFPEERVVVIDERFFRSARKQGLPALIPGWEAGRRRGTRGC